MQVAWHAWLLAHSLLAISLTVLPAQDRDTSGVPATSRAAPPASQRIDINHASLDELMKVPGMTQSWAGRIIRFRPYRTKQDLLEKGIVSEPVYDRIKDFIIAHRQAQ